MSWGRLESVTDGDGHTRSMSYGSDGLLAQIEDGEAATVDYTRDGGGPAHRGGRFVGHGAQLELGQRGPPGIREPRGGAAMTLLMLLAACSPPIDDNKAPSVFIDEPVAGGGPQRGRGLGESSSGQWIWTVTSSR